MQNNKIIQLALIAVMMLLSMVAISSLLEVRDGIRNVILGTGGFLILLFLSWRSIALDAKLLL